MNQFIISLVLVIFSLSANAQLTFTSPTSDQTVSYCEDYFNAEWNTRLSMDAADSGVLSDIPTFQVGQVSGLSYTNGNLEFTSTGPTPSVTFLQTTIEGGLTVGSRYGANHPIDSSKYKLFSVRLYSDQRTVAQLRWWYTNLNWAITTFDVYPGWYTYQIDLSTAVIASSSGANVGWTAGSPTGLELIPSNFAGVATKIDWVQLTSLASSCPNITTNFNAYPTGSNNLLSIFLDDNTSPSDGYLDKISKTATGATDSASFDTGMLFPGSYNLYGYITGDWATSEFGDPFDMNNSDDISSTSPFTNYQLGSTSFSGGKFNASSTGNDPVFYLNFPEGRTVDTSIYKTISIGITYNSGLAGTDYLQIFLLDENRNTLPVPISASISLGSNTIQLTPSVSVGWTGKIGGIRIDPTTKSGVNFSLDFVSIRKSGHVTSLAAPTPTVATGKITVDNISLGLVQPDIRGGIDYAQTYFSDPWNMDSSSDFQGFSDILSAQILPYASLYDEAGQANMANFYRVYNIARNGDPVQQLINYTSNIDTTRFLNVCFKGWNKTESPSAYNSVARILWGDPRFANTTQEYINGDDIVMTRSSKEYCVDMRNIQVEPALPSGSPNPWTDISSNGFNVNYFRIDMNENEEEAAAQYYSVIDYITLRTDHETSESFAIVVDASLDHEVKIYRNSNATTTGGTQIGTLPRSRDTNVFTWNLSTVPAGTYFIYTTITNGSNTVSRLSEGRIKVGPTLANDTTKPILNCESPANSSSFDSYLPIGGYALDETRLATVEVTIDGEYLANIRPDKFHYNAYLAYPQFTETEYSGFSENLNTSHLSTGSHSLLITAHDTAGNTSSCTRAVNKISGSTPAAHNFPASLNDWVLDIDLGSDPPLDLVISVSISQKKNIDINISNTDYCSGVTLVVGSDEDFSFQKSYYLSAGAASLTATLANFSPLKKPTGKVAKSKKKFVDGKIYVKATCNEGYVSNTALFSANKIKNPKKKSVPEKILIAAFKKFKLS